MSLLVVDKASRHFGSLVAVDAVSLTVSPGELRAIIGPNGAGKTTFFNLISGFFPPTSGRILFQGNDVTQRLEELLAMGGLTEKAGRLVGEFPHGDQRAAEIMMALALKPRLLLLDEPTAGMGDQETYDITQLIRRLHKDQQLTIVLIEHDMRVVFHLADRITVLAEGSVLGEGTPDEIARDERVQAAYLGKAA